MADQYARNVSDEIAPLAHATLTLLGPSTLDSGVRHATGQRWKARMAREMHRHAKRGRCLAHESLICGRGCSWLNVPVGGDSIALPQAKRIGNGWADRASHTPAACAGSLAAAGGRRQLAVVRPEAEAFHHGGVLSRRTLPHLW